jgi:hypothetical protein
MKKAGSALEYGKLILSREEIKKQFKVCAKMKIDMFEIYREVSRFASVSHMRQNNGPETPVYIASARGHFFEFYELKTKEIWSCIFRKEYGATNFKYFSFHLNYDLNLINSSDYISLDDSVWEKLYSCKTLKEVVDQCLVIANISEDRQIQ